MFRRKIWPPISYKSKSSARVALSLERFVKRSGAIADKAVNSQAQNSFPMADLGCKPASCRYACCMFSIEHEFDATVVTLVDEGSAPLQEDVIVHTFAECITVEQYDPRTDQVHKITLSTSQMKDLATAIDLPEGVYQRDESISRNP